MIEAAYEFDDGHGAGRLIVRGGIWSGEECVFEFVETLRGTSGTARCDWRQPAPYIEVRHGDGRDPAVRATLQKLGELLLPCHSGAFAGVTDATLAELYAGDYHRDQNYSNNHQFETRYKARIVDSVWRRGSCSTPAAPPARSCANCAPAASTRTASTSAPTSTASPIRRCAAVCARGRSRRSRSAPTTASTR
jgi:hypothetical protein